MAYTPSDARNNMNSLIDRMKEKRVVLRPLTLDPRFTSDEQAGIRTDRARLLSQITKRGTIAAFEEASATIIREPIPSEVEDLRESLEFMGRSISAVATFQEITLFISDVLEDNSDRFRDILKTIRFSSPDE